jgi:hypothetical protein
MNAVTRCLPILVFPFMALMGLACCSAGGAGCSPLPATPVAPTAAPTEVPFPTAVALPTAMPIPPTDTPSAAPTAAPAGLQGLSPENIQQVVALRQTNLRSGGAGGAELQGLAWSPDGQALAASFLVAQRFDAEALAELPLGETYGSIAFMPDGQLVSLLPNGTVQFWKPDDGQLAHEIEVDVLYSRGLAAGPDGKVVAAGTEHGAVYLWEAATGRLLDTPLGQTEAVLAVAFSPDSRLLAAGSADKTAAVYEQPGRLIYKLQHDAAVTGLAFSPDGRTLATVAFNIQLWDARTGEMLDQYPLDNSGEEDGAANVSFSPDGRLMAAGRCLRTAELECNPEIIIWEVGGGWLHTLEYETVNLGTPFGGIVLVAFSPDGSALASVDSVRTLKLWGLPTR